MTYNKEVRLSYLNQMRDKRHLNMKIMRETFEYEDHEREKNKSESHQKKKIVVGILFFR